MTALLNLKQPYGVVYGHDSARYSQDGHLYDGQYRRMTPPKVEVSMAGLTGDTDLDPLDSAKTFLKNLLAQNPLSKSVVYKEVESNNQVWDDVRNAAIAIGIIKYSQKNLEMWKLPEGVSA